jgi:hypothetical protein
MTNEEFNRELEALAVKCEENLVMIADEYDSGYCLGLRKSASIIREAIKKV